MLAMLLNTSRFSFKSLSICSQSFSVAYKSTETKRIFYNTNLFHSLVQGDYRYVANAIRSVTVVNWLVDSYSYP